MTQHGTPTCVPDTKQKRKGGGFSHASKFSPRSSRSPSSSPKVQPTYHEEPSSTAVPSDSSWGDPSFDTPKKWNPVQLASTPASTSDVTQGISVLSTTDPSGLTDIPWHALPTPPYPQHLLPSSVASSMYASRSEDQLAPLVSSSVSTGLSSNMFSPNPSLTSQPLGTEDYLGLYYEQTTSKQPSQDFKVPKLDSYSEKTYQQNIPPPISISMSVQSDFKLPYQTTSSSTSTLLTPNFPSTFTSIYSTDIQPSFFPMSQQPQQDICMDTSESGTAALVSSSVLDRAAPATTCPVLPTYGASSYSTSSSAFQLPCLDIFGQSDPGFAPGPLTMATNVLSNSSSPSSTDISSFGLDILDSELRTPPVTTALTSLSSPFSLPGSIPMHREQQSYSSLIHEQTSATSTNIFLETNVPITTSSPSTMSSSIIHSDVWRPY
ncbi:hypothetical protein JTE90_000614 [Oedothorax gibbosus]|uniref:Uncharacterized protein n=1 Tax=Oedothorax gibbosus TaxID=931172 RepID=A0AAV6VWT9_9ARAC|nr:hypothetical protein JTE90_000614 [Oedothorax gibbosus]